MQEPTVTVKEREVPPKRAPKTFLQTLQDIHYGHFANECDTALALCIAEAERTGKATEITVTLKFRPASKAQGRYDVINDVKTKLPPKEREAAIMFVGPDQNLTNSDPRQQNLPGIRAVSESGPGVRADQQDAPREAVRVA